MSNDVPTFGEILSSYVTQSRTSLVQLSALTRISPETIKNWLHGRRAKRPRTWHDVLKLAAALRLTLKETNHLLHTADYPPLHQLQIGAFLDQCTEPDHDLLSRWVVALTFAGYPGTATTIDPATLEAARRKLATMPLDRLPSPGELPACSHMPFRRNRWFVGRTDMLMQVAHAMKQGGSLAIGPTAAAVGMGGIGKTQLAIEFVHRYGHFFAGGVFWLNFSDPTTVLSDVAACGGAGCLALRPMFDQLPREEQIALVRAAWQSPLPRLLIFDNCEDETLLTQWRPTSGGSRVLVTSRRATWPALLDVTMIPLAELPRAESLLLLGTLCPPYAHDTSVLDQIADQLGDLPLALHLGGSYLLQYHQHLSPAAYLDQLQQAATIHHRSLGAASGSLTRHTQHITHIFDLSYQHLQTDDPIDRLACALLMRAAYLAPGELIVRDLWMALVKIHQGEDAAVLQASDAVSRLVTLGLVIPEQDGALRLHRLIVAFLREKPDHDHAQQVVEDTMLALALRFNETKTIEPLPGWQQHLRAVTDAGWERNENQAIALCRELGHYLWIVGDHAGAQMYLKRALTALHARPDADPLEIAAIQNLLALDLQTCNHLSEAQPLFEQALQTWHAVLGPNDDRTVTEYNNLGYLCLLQGTYATAHKYLRHALTKRKHLHGLHHPETARVLANLGYLLLHQGRYWTAGRAIDLALRIRQQLLPAVHVSMGYTWNFLGEAKYAQGRYVEAEHCFRRSLAIRQALFGDEHHDTAESVYNLGRIHYAAGAYADARTNFEHALRVLVATFGIIHWDTAVVLNAFGCVLREMGLFADAHAAFMEALTAWDGQGGERHPQYARPLTNVGLLYLQHGELRTAHDHVARALHLRQVLLGEDHPETAESYHALGQVLRAQGHRTEAHVTWTRALQICQRRLNPPHPLTQAVQHELRTVVPAAS